MRHPRLLHLAAGLTCAVLAAASPAIPQRQPARPQEEPPASLFGEEIDVRVVNVEVVVTDSQGQRVQDLKPGDFRLTVDGREVPIEYFTEVRGGQAVVPVVPGARAPGEAPAPPAVTGLPSLAAGEPVGTSYLVFVDDFFSIGSHRDVALRALKEDLVRLGPEDRMAIVAFDGKKLEMLTSWTSSQRELARAVDQALARRTHGARRTVELKNLDRARRTDAAEGFAPLPSFADRLDFEESDYAHRLANQARKAVTAVVGTLRGFAAPSGRKVMLVLSGGWPFSPEEFTVNDPTRRVYHQEIPGHQELYGPIVDTANLLGYTLYPVDLPGLETAGAGAGRPNVTPETARFGSVEGAGAPVSDPRTEIGLRPSPYETGVTFGAPAAGALHMRREHAVHSAVQYMALETGGRALLDQERSGALGIVAADTRSYYWLGFTPSWKRDDGRHKVEVAVRRAGLEVRSRESFRDLSRRAEAAMQVESAILFGSAPGIEPMPIKLGPPARSGRREMDVPFAVAIPVKAFTALPVDGKHVAELELRVAATDEDGNRSDIPVIPVRITTKEAPDPAKHVRYDARVRLRRVRQHLVVAAFDPVSGKMAVAEADVKP
jgi:VWFA-related protein